MKIIGISAYYHDSAAALIIDGKIIAASQEERYSRIKHDSQFPARAIQQVLYFAQIKIDEIDAFVFYEKPILTFERILETALATAPKGFSQFLLGMPIWMTQKLNMRATLEKEFKQQFNFSVKNKIFFSNHHLSHAASAFYPSSFESSAVLCMDGVGESICTSAWLGEGNNLKALWNQKYPHSLGLLYSTFTAFCGFKVNSGEYKLMGLA